MNKKIVFVFSLVILIMLISLVGARVETVSIKEESEKIVEYGKAYLKIKVYTFESEDELIWVAVRLGAKDGVEEFLDCHDSPFYKKAHLNIYDTVTCDLTWNWLRIGQVFRVNILRIKAKGFDMKTRELTLDVQDLVDLEKQIVAMGLIRAIKEADPRTPSAMGSKKGAFTFQPQDISALKSKGIDTSYEYIAKYMKLTDPRNGGTVKIKVQSVDGEDALVFLGIDEGVKYEVVFSFPGYNDLSGTFKFREAELVPLQEGDLK